jgi:preflagellin peptidase FlaK
MAQWIIHNIDFLISLTILGIASIMDLRKREVSDWLWAIAYPIAILVIVFKAFNHLLDLYDYLLAMPIFILSLIILFTGLMGGADAKALIAIALLTPKNALATFFTALILELLAMALPILFMNLSRIARERSYLLELSALPVWKKALILLSSMKLEHEPKHLEWMKTFDGKDVSLLTDVEMDVPIAKKGEWGTPLIPFLPFLLMAYIVLWFHPFFNI